MAPDDDDALLESLRRAAADADPVPEIVLANARAAVETRDLDARLARLVADSADPAGSDRLDAVRGGGPGVIEDRLLLYEAGGVRIDLAVRDEGGTLTLVGKLGGASTVDCVIERGDGRADPVDVDALGRFLVDGVSPGPLRLRCLGGAGNPVVTPWTNL